MRDWGDGGHKKKCKKEKVAYDKYCKEIETNSPDPNRFMQDGGSIPWLNTNRAIFDSRSAIKLSVSWKEVFMELVVLSRYIIVNRVFQIRHHIRLGWIVRQPTDKTFLPNTIL